MSLGGILGTAVGGIGGFMIGGPAGAMMGASLGGSLGGALDAPDVPKANPGAYASQVDPAIEQKIKRNVLTGQDQNVMNFARNQMAGQVAGQNAQIASARGVNAGLAHRMGAFGLSQGLADASVRANQLGASTVNQQLGAYLGAKAGDRQASIQADQARMNSELAQQQRDQQMWSGIMNGLGQAGMTMYGMPATEQPLELGKPQAPVAVNYNPANNPYQFTA